MPASRLIKRVVLFAVLAAVAACLLVVWSNRKNRRENLEAEALRTLATLHASLASYAQSFPAVGFPASLEQLAANPGPRTCRNAALLDQRFTRDEFAHQGYAFSYRLVEGSGRCREAGASPGTRYLLVARPSFALGASEFLLDESGRVRTASGREREFSISTVAGVPAVPEAGTESAGGSGLVVPDVVWMGSGELAWKVRLNHQAHVEKYGIACQLCHHPPRTERPPVAGDFQACSSCHELAVRIPMRTTLQLAFHDARASSGLCIDCHQTKSEQGLDPPLACEGCHAPFTGEGAR